MPKVSVIIPAYNQAQFLEGAIRSVLCQTFRDYEIIVVDDGSTDNTPAVAEKFASQIRYIRQENKGLAGARNTGIRAAQGEWIGLLDSDDEWLPGYLEEMAELAEKNPEAVVFYCAAQGVDVDGKPLPQQFVAPVLPPEQLHRALVRANCLIPSTILMRTAVVREAGYFDESLRSCEDWDLWLRLLPKQVFVGSAECLVKYRIHGSSLSTNPTGMQQAARAVIEKHFGVDDGKPAEWSELKRRAWGGLYFYHAWTSILRKGDWEAAGEYIASALRTDPDLISSLDFYYELLLGRQPVGYRGSSQFLDLPHNFRALQSILVKLETTQPQLKEKKPSAYACYAAGLLAYNTQNLSLARGYLLAALRQSKALWRDRRLMSLLMRAWAPRPLLRLLRTLKRRGQYAR